jgi:hypothetical protein
MRGTDAPAKEGTVAHAAEDMLKQLERAWAEVVGNGRFGELVQWAWENGCSGTEEEEKIVRWVDQPTESRPSAFLQLVLVPCGYIIEAIHAENRGEVVTAWMALAKANFWLGFLLGSKGFDAKAAAAEGRQRGLQNRAEIYLRARRWVWRRWQEEKEGYGGIRSAAARDYERMIPQLFTNAAGDPLKVSRDTLADKWLKDPPDQEMSDKSR